MLGHEQFSDPTLGRNGALASRAGFDLLATSAHLQPWRANEGRSGEAWVSSGVLGALVPTGWMGTTVTCPTLRYIAAVVAEAFASLSPAVPWPDISRFGFRRGAEPAGRDSGVSIVNIHAGQMDQKSHRLLWVTDPAETQAPGVVPCWRRASPAGDNVLVVIRTNRLRLPTSKLAIVHT